DEVGAAIYKDALRGQPIAPGTPRFLLVVLRRTRRGGMRDESHVRAIDAHPERDRRHDDVGLLAEKGFLMPASNLVCETGMIRQRAMSFLLQPFGQRFDLAPRRAVHDSGFA